MISITEIGITAGEIWHYLDTNGDAKLDQLTEVLNKDRDLVLMSLGWLAREGHITLDNAASNFRAALKTPAEKSE